MLSRPELEDLIFMRLPEEAARERLMSLTLEALPDDELLPLLETAISIVWETAVPLPRLKQSVMDCCGTGGSGLPHYNTSTTVAFVLAAGGVPVVKFGNRAMTSKSGSFDFLEGLGIPLETPLEGIPDILHESGLVFLFAPQVYPALGRLTALRRSVKVRTLFNFMGPLLNPFSPAFRLLGVSDVTMQAITAELLSWDPATRHALVVRSENDMDELEASCSTCLMEVRGGRVNTDSYVPSRKALANAPPTPTILGVKENLAIFHRLIQGQGEETDPAIYQQVCLNAGAGFYTANRARSIEEGIVLARKLLDKGKVRETMEACRRAYANCPA